MASVLVVDALARGYKGKRMVTVDAIGAGPRTVAGVVEQAGFNVDLTVAENVLADPSLFARYEVLLISAMSIDEPTVARMVRAWRRRSRGPVVVGGPAALDSRFLVRVGGDIAVYGEAEPVIDRLFREEIVSERGVDVERALQLCGVVVRDGKSSGGVIVRPRCPFMPRRVWEKYRPSSRHIVEYPMYWAARVYVEAVRGCSNYTIPKLEEVLPPELLPEKPLPGCAYCSVIRLWGYARSRSIDHLYEEVKGLIDMGARRIVLSGPDFLDYGRDWLVEPQPLVNPIEPPPNTRAIRSLLKRLTSIPEVASGEAAVMVENVKPSLVDEESASALGDYLAGTPVHIGVETGDERLLRALGRPVTLRKTLEAVKTLIRHRLRLYVYIMYCLPGETGETIEKTVRLMEKLYRLGVEKITAYKFMPLPGSALEKLASKPVKCPRPHPVRLKAEELNYLAKKRLRGRRTRAIIVGKHGKLGKYVAYPLTHGPVVVIEDRGRVREGDLVEIRLTGVVSDRMVKGVIVRRLGSVIRGNHLPAAI